MTWEGVRNAVEKSAKFEGNPSFVELFGENQQWKKVYNYIDNEVLQLIDFLGLSVLMMC